MVKLSQQLKVQRSVPVRRTRTERKIAVRVGERRRLAELQERARQVQEEKLSGDIKSIDNYETIYNTIEPELRQFFTAPNILRQEKTKRINQSIFQVQEKQSDINEELRELKEEHDNDLIELRERFTGDKRSKKRRELEDNFDEERKFLEGVSQGLGEGLSKLQGGQEINFGDIENFADEKGHFERQREEAKNKSSAEQKQAFGKLLETPFAPVFLKAKKKFGDNIDWTNPENIKKIYQNQYVETYQKQIGRDIASGKEDSIFVKQYKEIVGEKQFKETSKEIERLRLEDLKKRKAERDPFIDVESIKGRENLATKIRSTGSKIINLALDRSSIRVLGITGVFGVDVPVKKVVSTVEKGVKKGGEFILKQVEDINIPIFAGTGTTDFEGLSVRKIKDPIKEKISKKQLELFLSQITKLGIKEEFDPIFEAEYSARFEDKFGEKIIKGEITFEEAEKQFRKSDEAKKVQARFGKVIEKRRQRASILSKESLALAGLSIADLGIKLIPETKGELLLEGIVVGGIIYTGGQITRVVSPTVITGGFGVLGVLGTLELLDVSLPPEKRLLGGAVAVTSAVLLGVQAVKFLKTPTIKQQIIKPPKLSIKTSSISVEKEILKRKSLGVTTDIERFVFPNQKLQQIGIAGRRTVISTRWRDILKLDPIYRGVPSTQRGTTYTLRSFRGDFTFTSGSGYQKSFKLLSKSNQALLTTGGETQLISLKGASTSQIKEILRFHAPKVIDVTLERGVLGVVGEKARGQFTFRIDQRVIDVDKLLGIKTRGAKSIRKVADFDRFIDQQGAVVTNIRETTMFVTKDGASFNTLRQAGKTTTRSIEKSIVTIEDIKKSFKIGKEFEFGGGFIKEKIPFEFQKLTGDFVRKQIVPLKRRLISGRQETIIARNEGQRTIISVDLDEIRGLRISSAKDFITPAKIVKTPLSKTFAEETAVKEIKNIIARQGKPIPFKITRDVVTDSASQKLVQESQFAGTGLYERTESVAISSLKNQALKLGFDPVINIKTQIKNLAKFDQAFVSKSALNVATLSALGLSTQLKSSLKFDQALKLDLKLGQGLKQDLIVKQAIKQAQVLKQVPALSLKQALKLGQAQSIASTSIFKEPIIATFKLPKIPIITIPFGLPTAKQRIKKSMDEKKLLQELAFLPDFTSRALGLEPEIITESQALKKIKKLQTGFEIRRPIKLLRGIPE